MEILLFIIPVAAGVGLIFLALFFWAWKTGQFEDVDGPAHRMIRNRDD